MRRVSLSNNMVHGGNLILINSRYPYKECCADINLISVGPADNSVFLKRQYAAIFTKVMDDLGAWGQITAVSGWRSRQEQEQIYHRSLQENGAGFTAKYVAQPGHSEHQAGLAADLTINQPPIDALRPCFTYTGICQAFRSRASHYGLIERYPKGKEDITGIAHEPWHFRYVGAPHAMLMEQTGDTLEEYHIRLRQYIFGQKPLKYDFGGAMIEISYLAAEDEMVTFEIADDTAYTVSGNNMDGFIITVWR